MSIDESNGNESPKKRARTGSLSDCGGAPCLISTGMGADLLFVEMDADNTQKEPEPAKKATAEINGEEDANAMNVTINDTSSGSVDGDVVPSTPPTKEEQLNILKSSFTARLTISSTLYLIPTKWYEAFSAWAQGTAQEPGRVDPRPILCDAYGVLREDVVEDKDWLATNEDGWCLIRRWYNPCDSSSV